jgi:hypothetical protein
MPGLAPRGKFVRTAACFTVMGKIVKWFWAI